MERKYRPTFWKKWSQKGVVSITDQLNIHKVLFSATERGKDSVRAYLESRKALTLANAIINGNFRALWPANQDAQGYKIVGKYEVYGGSRSSKAYGGKPESRIIEFAQIVDKDTKGNDRARFTITISVGEGVVDDKGTIKPRDRKAMISQRQFLTMEEVYEMATMLQLHISAYYTHYMEFIYDSDGEVRGKGSVEDFYKSEFRPADDQVPTSSDRSGSDEVPLM